MTWLNPWACLGAAAIALPILIHLLGRGHARAYRFPTLRFLAASRLLPTRRTRIHDIILLIVRCGVIVLAAAALARPLVLTRERRQSLDGGLARAIVVDTSMSMRRLMPSGATALDSALHDARVFAIGGATSVLVKSANLADAIKSANEWLTKQGRTGELVVISDFQRDAVTQGDFSSVRKEFGIALRRVPVTASAKTESRATGNGVDVVAQGTVAGDRTDAEWTARGVSSLSDAVLVLGGDADHDAIRATQEAARSVLVPLPLDTSRTVAIVFAKYAQAARYKATATAAYAAWMVDLLGRLRQESIAVESSGVANESGRSQLLLFTGLEPGSLGATRLVAAVNRGVSIAPSATELDPETISDVALAAMQRAATNDAASPSRGLGDKGPSDGRWVWIAVLVLLIVETALRRDRREPNVAVNRDAISTGLAQQTSNRESTRAS